MRAGWSIGQAAWRLGLSIRELLDITAPRRALAGSGDARDRICKLFGLTSCVRRLQAADASSDVTTTTA
jgi:hypothetical protein